MTKAEDAREHFIQISDAMFFEQGYDAVGVADICKRAGRAKGLFFYYFEKKENVVKALAERQIKVMAEHLTKAVAQMPLSAIQTLSFLMRTLVSKDSQGPRAMTYFKETGIPEWFDFFAHALKDQYIYPIIRDVVRKIAEENEDTQIDDGQIEIIYLGISAFMHRNFSKMSDADYYADAIASLSATLENALRLPKGTIIIE